jgi:ribosomal protein S18 acetylase RimI-like enzyme
VTDIEILDLPDDRRDDALALWHASGLTRPWNDPVADLDRALAGPSSTVLAALDGGRLAGTVMVGHDGHRGWLYYLAVDDDRRGQGIGRALVAAAETWASRAVPKVQLMVREENPGVVAFYERLGYERSPVVVLARRPG